jgi:error-prone DNA polymerase
VWDITQFCVRSDILCQGRGSAANSAVCYSLGVTKADAVRMGLLFERFLSVERDGPPDIDIDIENGRREEVIQYVYDRHGRLHAAQVANVITYRPRSAIREAAKALGHSTGTVDAWSKQLERYGRVQAAAVDSDIPADVITLARRLEGFPRHLGIHSGGMVMCDRPVVEVCPVEWGTMPGRTVLQWDKEDCAAAGLVKFDLLGLGMLSAVHRTINLIRDHHGVTVDLAALPQEDEVYDLLCAADTVGVFQVESRAQMATLPRLKPRNFYDLVVEVALIRPGPIQGGSVHPYLRRRNDQEPITYLHPMLEDCLRRTLGVPLFQEQLMEMAVTVAGFTPGEADRLRSAMGSKRSPERMGALRQRFFTGLAANNITGKLADEIWSKMAAFASFGFPESHSISFAYIVYESAWLKVHYPAALLAGLLNSQPMGFWAPRTLIADARRHGVEVLRPDANASSATATLEGDRERPAVRLGIASVRALSDETAEQVAAGRPYDNLEDLARRAELTRPQMEALATAGATDGLTSGGRRAALWAAGAVADSGPDRLPGLAVGTDAPDLPAMTVTEEVIADLWATGVTVDTSLTELARPDLDQRGVTVAGNLGGLADRARVVVAGIVTHRQRPETAAGVTFVSLEDETGLVNVVVSVGCWKRHRKVAQSAAAMIITGRVETADDTINVVAERIEPLDLAAPTRSRDFA